MAIYTHYEIANSPEKAWADVMGASYSGSSAPLIFNNSDGTLTKAHGPFVIIIGQGFGIVTSLERTSADGQIVYESIAGLSYPVSSLLADQPQNRLIGVFDAGNDESYGHSGNDFLLGGVGQDFLVGGAGNDDLNGGPGADKLYGGDGVDTANYSSSLSSVIVDLSTNVHTGGDAQGDTFLSIENIVGSKFSDNLTGNSGANVIEGGFGSDVIDGRDGDDTAVYAYNFNDYTVMQFGPRTYVKGLDAYDKLTSIEHLKFADVTITPANIANDGNPLFDTLYYLSRNPDVFQAGVNALDHFNMQGWHEGRDPNVFFDTSDYLSVYKDAAASGMNPLDHYHQIGWKEGHDPSRAFDTKFYLVRNPDVAAAGVDPLEHYLQFGLSEGRQAYDAIGENIVNGFDAEYYLFRNPDVAAAGVDPLAHFNQFGWHEGRKANAWFDTAGYLSHYADVAAAGVNPLEHYMQFGWKEGRDPSAHFDTLGYLAANPDVAAAGINPLEHYLQHGIYEGRQLGSDGMWG